MARKPTTPNRFPADAFTAGVPDEPEDQTQTPETPPDEPDEPEVTLGDLITVEAYVDPAQPVLPGFAMSDEPIEQPSIVAGMLEDNQGPSFIEERNRLAREQGFITNQGLTPQFPAPAFNQPSVPAGGPGLDGDVILPQHLDGVAPRYESRIRVLDAWQYPGNVTHAPAYVDRNWIGYASDDDVRQLPAGPCLRVPLTADPEENVVIICRRGDFVVHEAITADNGVTYEKVEVWEKDQFMRLFMPAATDKDAAETLVRAAANTPKIKRKA